MSENKFLNTLSASSIRNFLPRSVSTKKKLNSSRFKNKMNTENVAPMDPNIQISDPPLLPTSSILKKPVSKTIDTDKLEELNRSLAPQEQLLEVHDPPVKVVARIRPANRIENGTQAVRKVSDNSVCVVDRKFNFDMVFGSNSNQEDIFQSVGAPLVKDALAGYNTSLLAYGQTGSGKTYTMWGPPSSIVEAPSPNGLQGIVPRIFQTLFSSIQREQENSEGKQINYQCRCSFLEIYDEHIGDLLDPTQRNLKIMDDPRVGFYVENITEEYVSTYEDVTQMLIKGLSSRKVGSTSINSKSSRSHIVFTCVIESWCKESSSKCFGSSKMSRMSLVDLAGFERTVPDDVGKQYLKEGKYVKKSTSLLGHLVNVLSERSQSRKLEDVSYSSSALTHLMRESLGGNAKLSVICAISPENKHNSETISTLRFGNRVKLIPNEPLVNEISEDDVNGLSDQIRQLKEELIRARSSASISVGSNYGSFRGANVRESLNQLRVSLNRSLILPSIDNEREEEEVHINENDIKELQLQIDNLRGSHGNNSKATFEKKNSLKYSSGESEHYLSCSEESEGEEINSEEILEETLDDADQEMKTMQPEYCSSISISPSRHSADLQGPLLSESPKFRSNQRKSLIISSEDNIQCSSKSSELSSLPQKQGDLIQSSLRSSRIFPGPTESLAASLHRGLEIIDYHQRNSASNKSLVSFSFEHLAVKPSPMSNDKANASIQTSSEGEQTSPFVATSFLCPKCKTKGTSSSIGTWMVPMEEASSDQVPKDSEKVLFQALEREKQLESVCKDQADKIEQLNKRLAQCKCSIEQSSLIECGKDAVDLKDNEKQASIIYQNGSQSPKNPKLLKWDDDENPESEAVTEKYEIKEIQGDVDNCGGKKLFDMAEREAMLKELGGLSTTNKSIERTRSSLLAQSMQLRKSIACAKGSGEELEKEREKWTEMESEWICLTDELRIDLEAHRQRAEKVAAELMLEKKCTDELDDALKRSVLGQARMIEHYAELQDKYNDLAEKHKLILQGIQDVKMAAAKAGKKGHGARFAKSLAAELSALRVEREREREMLKKENRSLRVQLKDTAEAVHAAGELLVRLREAEETASFAEENFTQAKEENEKLKKQIEKLKRKHKMEMITMKQYLAESRLPEAALRPPVYRQDSDVANNENTIQHNEYDDQSWRAEFGAIYQEHI
ncbi:kinesin-like protein KIN-12F isoform X1 [Lycium barbarum]|uniref:kinesin-like protein KIN-12F isoform X1 n=1 Tax=Lycium barbarum TaxID=112863 RepID=UPI00293F454F|nr:kinesin-like protein KIN-12F isoform X1 [Lycium barbarum]